MNTILSIARFEFRYQLRQPIFYVWAVLIFGQGVWYADRSMSLYSFSDLAAAAYFTLSSLGVVLAMAAVLLAGQSLTKDSDYRVAPYLYALPITSRMHLAGRFIGTYLTVLLLAFFYPLGILVLFVSYPASAGSMPWMALLDGFVCLISQNLFIVVSISFSLTVFLRSIRGAYVALFLVVLYFLLTETSTTILSESDLWQLLDPFGVGMTRASVEALNRTPDELLSMSPMLLINRLLWLGLALGLLAQAENRFSFDLLTDTKQQKKQTPESGNPSPSFAPQSMVTVRQTFGGWVQGQTLGQVSRMEFLNLIRQPVFQLTTGLIILLTVLLATVFMGSADFPELPLTSRLTALRLPMGLFIGLFVLIMTGELIFYERTVSFWSIYDALPQPAFVLILGKLVALTGATALLSLVLFLTGVGIQLSAGFTDIEWGLYASDLLLDGFLRYTQLIALGALVATLTANRLVGHAVNLLIFLILIVSYQTAHSGQYAYSFLPGSAQYSDLHGYGVHSFLRPIMHVVWWGMAGVFMILALQLWNRGMPVSLIRRIGRWPHRFGWPSAVGLVLCSLVSGAGLWYSQQQSRLEISEKQIAYTTATAVFPSVSGRPLTLQIQYHHPYQIRHVLSAAQSALRRGEQLFGAFPYATLRIREVPHGSTAISSEPDLSGPDSSKPGQSRPGQIMVSEKQGWAADYRQPAQLDYVDYLVSREVFKQWLVHRLQPIQQPGDGFVKQSLAEYLSLQQVANQYGPERLRQRLAQRMRLYSAGRRRTTNAPEKTLLQSSGNEALERGRAALALTSIGQVWGEGPLSLTISQFYRQAIQQPASATATAFAAQLTRNLPDSLRYLTTYLCEPLWFDFSLGRMANLPNGLRVEIVAAKWRETSPGRRQPVPIDDYIPLTVLDADDRAIYHQLAKLMSSPSQTNTVLDEEGHELYHQLVHPHPDEPFVVLPVLPGARRVVIDPAGAWPELNKRDNTKLF